MAQVAGMGDSRTAACAHRPEIAAAAGHHTGMLDLRCRYPEMTAPRAHRMDGSSCLIWVSYTPAL